MSFENLSNDLINLIFQNLDYKILINCRTVSVYLNKTIEYKYIIKKINLIIKFLKKKFYTNFYDLRNNFRNGYLINLNNILKRPQKYEFEILQCIVSYQYNNLYLPCGYVIEGYVVCHIDSNKWVIYDHKSKKIQPLLLGFVLPKSIRIIRHL